MNKRHPSLTKAQTLMSTEDEAQMRLDRFLRHRFPHISLSYIQKMIRTGQVRLNGKRVEGKDRLQAGAHIRVPPLQDPTYAMDTKPPLENPHVEKDRQKIKDMILFEDPYVMVLNKPPGIAVQGGSGTKVHIDGWLQAFTDSKGQRPMLVHRLDRDTSGVLLVAKTKRIAAELGEIFRSRQATKIYWALVEGVPKPAQGRISLFLAKGPGMGDQRQKTSSWEEREKMRVAKHGDPEAQHSLTYYAVVDKVSPRLSWLSLKPITGRTHQLRAHAEAMGHPIIGDPKYYGTKARNDPRLTDPLRAIPLEIERTLHLLARRLILPHPRGGMLDVTAPLPSHMRQAFDLFGFDDSQEDPIFQAPEY